MARLSEAMRKWTQMLDVHVMGRLDVRISLPNRSACLLRICLAWRSSHRNQWCHDSSILLSALTLLMIKLAKRKKKKKKKKKEKKHREPSPVRVSYEKWKVIAKTSWNKLAPFHTEIRFLFSFRFFFFFRHL